MVLLKQFNENNLAEKSPFHYFKLSYKSKIGNKHVISHYYGSELENYI